MWAGASACALRAPSPRAVLAGADAVISAGGARRSEGASGYVLGALARAAAMRGSRPVLPRGQFELAVQRPQRLTLVHARRTVAEKYTWRRKEPQGRRARLLKACC